ncbi:hypothetical protein EV426DRAFT_242584 [Tirmania nivea]|nr:hypothetical protein EV426DRAFT_242584 [Tirmania nivea]
MDPQSISTSSFIPSPPQFDTTHNLLNSCTFLLHLIEPVRIYTPPSPPPVNFSGAGRSNEDNHSSEKLKRRLIDALAFICATEREGDSGAAVCIEEAITREVEGAHACDEDLATELGEYTLRIAKNGWVGEEVLQGVRDIIKLLEAFADGSPSSSPTVSSAASLYHQTDAQVYSAIISLHLSKVLYHLSEIREPITHVQEALVQHLSAGEEDPRRILALSVLTASEIKKLQTWLRSFIAQVVAAEEAGEKQIPITAVSAAYQVRRSPVFGHLETLCKSVGCQVVGVHMVKLGRYKAACRTLIHACQKWPELFVGMKVEGVPEVEDDVVPNFNLLPRPTREMEIRRTVTEIIQRDDIAAAEAVTEEGVQALLPTISEEQFATAWASRVAPCTGHAEIRLVEFYEENRNRRPISGSTDLRERQVRYIGMSKKPCYLCQMFVDRHPARYMLGGLEGEKSGIRVKRVLDPYWRLRSVGGAEYGRLLDEMREVVEQELRTEVEKWVIRGSDEEVLGRERPRGRARAKGKRNLKRGKPKLEPQTSSFSNASSSDGGGTSLTIESEHGNPTTGTAPEGLTKAPAQGSLGVGLEAETVITETKLQSHDTTAMSEDEEEGVKLVQPSVEGVAVEPQLTFVEVPNLIMPMTETGPDAPYHATNLTMISTPPRSPPPPNLIDDEPEFLSLSSATLSLVESMPIADASPAIHSKNSMPPISPTPAEFHSETQFIEESEFKLLSPIPEEDDETLVLVNLEAVLVKLADLEEENTDVSQGEEVTRQTIELLHRARAMSDAERDLLGLDFTFVAAEEPESKSTTAISEAPALEAYSGNLAPGGYLVLEDLEEGCSIAPGGYLVVEFPEEQKEVTSGGYFVIAAEQAGMVLPGGYLASETKLKEEGAFAPGGYLVAEMKGEVEIATLISDEIADAPLLTVPQQPVQKEAAVLASMPRILAPGGYIVTGHEDGVLIASGGYIVIMPRDPENSGCIQSDPASNTVSAPLLNEHETQSRSIALGMQGSEVDVLVDSDVTKHGNLIQMHPPVAASGGPDEGSADMDEGYDVINIDQEREKKAPVGLTEPLAALGIAAPSTFEAGEPHCQLPSSSETAFPPPSPIVVPTAEKLGSMDSGSPDIDAIHVTTNLSSSPSSSTHTTLSTSTTLANNSTPTTPRLRSSASLLFSPSLRRASTWAPPTTATTIANTPGITSIGLTEDIVLLPISRPGTALGDMEDNKPGEVRPFGSGGWLAKKLLRASTSSNGVNAPTASNLEAPEDGAEVLPRRGSFSSLRPSTSNGNRDMLSGTAKALITLRALQTQVRQKK